VVPKKSGCAAAQPPENYAAQGPAAWKRGACMISYIHAPLPISVMPIWSFYVEGYGNEYGGPKIAKRCGPAPLDWA